MWDAAKHPRGYHGQFGATGHRKVVNFWPRRRQVKPGEIAATPRVVWESVYRENGRIVKTDKARARTRRRSPLDSIRTYEYK